MSSALLISVLIVAWFAIPRRYRRVAFWSFIAWHLISPAGAVATAAVLTTVARGKSARHRRSLPTSWRPGRDPLRGATDIQRQYVLARDGHRCRYCGAGGPLAELNMDHVIPWARGGATTTANLQALCSGCNRRKSCRGEWWARTDFRRRTGVPAIAGELPGALYRAPRPPRALWTGPAVRPRSAAA